MEFEFIFVCCFALIFILFGIYFGLKTVKERALSGFNALKTFLIYIFFSLSMAMFCIYIFVNYVVSIIIFICLSWICIITSVIESKRVSLVVIDLFISSICIIFLLLLPVPENILEFSYFSLFLLFLLISFYLLPLLYCFDKKGNIINKIKNCTYEVSARVISVIYYKRKGIYIPKLEFEYNGKKYKYSDSDSLLFKDEIKEGDVVPLLINPETKKFNKNNCNVFFPGKELDEFMSFEVKLWYIFTTLIILLVLVL